MLHKINFFLLRKQLELYTELIKDYDRKNKELIIENNDLKTFLSQVYLNLNKCLDDKNSDECSFVHENHSDLSEEIVRFSFDYIFAKVDKEFKSKFDIIKEKFSHKLEINHTLTNLTISSINSIPIDKSRNSINENHSATLNSTFTVDEKRQPDDFLEKTINSISPCSSISSPSISVLSNKISNRVVNKDKINVRESSAIELEEEKNKLAMERKYFYEQKLKLEEDTSKFSQISSELVKEVNKNLYINICKNLYCIFI